MNTRATAADADEVARNAPGSRRAPAGAALLSVEFGLLLLLVLFCGGFALLTHGFTSPFNLFALTRTGAINVLVGLAMMTVIVTGGLDLSIGAVGVAAGMAAGWLMQVWHLPTAAGILGALLVGAGLGLLNGQLIVRSGMHSFVVSLATMSIFFGAMIVLTRAQPFNLLPDGFTGFARIHWWRVVSPMLVVALAAGALLHLLYRYTDLGREMLACGASPRAASSRFSAEARSGTESTSVPSRSSSSVPGMTTPPGLVIAVSRRNEA